MTDNKILYLPEKKRNRGLSPTTPPNYSTPLGVGKRQAILTGISSKSWWHLSKTKATQMGMNNEWLESQGLISVRDLWLKAQGYV